MKMKEEKEEERGILRHHITPKFDWTLEEGREKEGRKEGSRAVQSLPNTCLI